LDEIPIGTLIGLFVVLLIISGFFSISETSMMALNKYRLKHLAKKNHKGAKRTVRLLDQTDRLLGSILLGNNLSNTAAAALVTAITFEVFGQSEFSLTLATLIVTVALLIFSEITPKIIGASYPERIALPASFILEPLMKIMHPIVSLANIIVRGALWVIRIKPPKSDASYTLNQEELRTLVLEGGNFLPKKHRSMLLNLFDLQQISVEDVMVPRAKIESINLEESIENIRQEIATSNHTRLPVYKGDPDEVIGIVHIRKLLNLTEWDAISKDDIAQAIKAPYFIPKDTALLAQLQNFQEQKDRMGCVVNEYGELLGLVTIEDIIEEIIGEFTTQSPLALTTVKAMDDGSIVADGATTIREINREFKFDLPLDGPKTLNGLILEELQQIPEAGISIEVEGHYFEILQTKDKSVKSVRISKKTKT